MLLQNTRNSVEGGIIEVAVLCQLANLSIIPSTATYRGQQNLRGAVITQHEVNLSDKSVAW